MVSNIERGMQMGNDFFMRIIPRELDHATIICDMKRSEEVRDELQRLAYDIYIALNETPEHICLVYNPDAEGITIYSAFGMDKKFKYDVILHPYDDTNFLMNYLGGLAKGPIQRINKH